MEIGVYTGARAKRPAFLSLLNHNHHEPSPPPPSSSPTRRSGTASGLPDNDGSWKRLYLGQLKESSSTKRKDKDNRVSSTQQLGRGLRRIGDLYMDLPGAIRLSDQYLVNEEADVTNPPLDPEGRVDEDELEARRG
ncbi:hypothetical protein H1R20_g12889, partial [Candolleomyces eurysporus]